MTAKTPAIFGNTNAPILLRLYSSGGKDRLLGISKRGDPYLRSILIHGARSTVAHAKNKEDRLSLWMTRLAQRRHLNVAAVAFPPRPLDPDDRFRQGHSVKKTVLDSTHEVVLLPDICWPALFWQRVYGCSCPRG